MGGSKAKNIVNNNKQVEPRTTVVITPAQNKEDGNKKLVVNGTSTPISSPTPIKTLKTRRVQGSVL